MNRRGSSMRNKTHFKLNKNKNLIYQDSWVLWKQCSGKFTALNAYVRKEDLKSLF